MSATGRPYSRHMNRFGRSDEALQGVLAFERWDRMALANIRKVLERHGFSSKAILDGVSDSAAVLLQEPHLLPKLQRIGSLQKSSLQPTTPPGPWTKVESRTFVMEPSLECPLKSLELPRSVGTFTERAASFKLPLSKYTRADDMVDIVESQGYIHVLSDSVADGMRLYSVDTDKWECTQRSLGISAARWMHTDAPSAEVVVNGRRPRSRNKPQLMVVDQKVLVWNPAAGILVAMPEHNRNRGVVHRLFVSKPDSFIAVAAGDGRSLKLIGTREMYEVDISQDSARLRLLLRSPETLAHITNIASGGSAIVVTAQNGRGMQIDARGASRLAFPVAPVVYDFANSVYQSADPTGAFFYRVEVDGSIWECPGEASRAGFTLSSVVGRSGTILNCRVGELEIVDTVQPASVRHLPLRECAVQCITEMKEGRQLAILYTDGWIDVIEILREQLAVAEKEYRQLRSLPTREDHRTASGQPKHGKEDDAPHVGGNTFAGGTGGADTAGLGGVGGPYRLDKGHPVHQVSDEVKASISPEAAEAARKMGQEALRKRLEEIRMSEADWQRYREIVDGVADEIAQLRRVLHTADSRLRERKWLAGTEGELDEE
ncbi:hypothetical protein Pmar_PMAR028156 [Perkinsus marinus ATCC 50983]|uniref:Uncharacterized protein n=1 Tax=Perkinsus marinus (strain ATCC 50983 / TXsc) TaxID=423536 RepID=C5LB41_PERM5|nr:hypothetical protein Pmar_PMAR028156 [Perkinsus marinus ATCC 50983]EER05969.1 hypothetical protein Pmar_PMAR028156 [Perkinsus marinus ATCC 50983]|eukprot:XP_002774153.1 hypothetical protein Pmar_PMAR028156 [Perkinsus marinus ATCC 50983]